MSTLTQDWQTDWLTDLSTPYAMSTTYLPTLQLVKVNQLEAVFADRLQFRASHRSEKSLVAQPFGLCSIYASQQKGKVMMTEHTTRNPCSTQILGNRQSFRRQPNEKILKSNEVDSQMRVSALLLMTQTIGLHLKATVQVYPINPSSLYKLYIHASKEMNVFLPLQFSVFSFHSYTHFNR